MLLTAPLIHNGYHFLPAGAAIEVNQDGTITAVHESGQFARAIAYEGMLCPGFINVHCHLELSHLKGVLPEHTSLIPFLQKVPSYRTRFTDEQKKQARHAAYQELLNNGVVAVGDISNVTDTLDVRALDHLHMHTFVECIGFTAQHAEQKFKAAKEVFDDFSTQLQGKKMLRQSIVPHAPYSVSQSVFRLIDKHQVQSIISIHNQESRAEDEYYKQKTGGVKDLLGGFGINDDFFQPTGTSSLQRYAAWLSPDHSVILVHNTYTTQEDVNFANSRFTDAFWCLCPNANLYIENTLPDVNLLVAEGARICIGTDSLASNHQLSILSELATLRLHVPELDWETLLRWATLHGAQALRMSHTLGSFEVGKQPGIINITGAESGKPSVQRVM